MEKAFIILGIKHSGKSTQGKILSEKLNAVFIDVDDLITENTGKTPREIYNEFGKEAFMKEEETACKIIHEKFLENNKNGKSKFVVSTGGGISDNTEALKILKTFGFFIYLHASESVVLTRILRKTSQDESGQWIGLPAYISKENPKDEEQIKKIFHNFYVRRTEAYKKIADKTIVMKDSSKYENAELIFNELKL